MAAPARARASSARSLSPIHEPTKANQPAVMMAHSVTKPLLHIRSEFQSYFIQTFGKEFFMHFSPII